MSKIEDVEQILWELLPESCRKDECTYLQPEMLKLSCEWCVFQQARKYFKEE